MRCAITEAEAREEVIEVMEERMRNMEKRYQKRLTNEVEMNERKMDAKIDMLHRTGLLGSGRVSETEEEGEEEEEYVSNVLTCVMATPAHRAVEREGKPCS
jgi:kinesin family protein 20